MALTEAAHYFKTSKEGTQRITAKYHHAANKAYLEDAYKSTVKILERAPYVSPEDVRIQHEQVLNNAAGKKITVDDVVYDGIAHEIEKEGFIDRVYNYKGT